MSKSATCLAELRKTVLARLANKARTYRHEAKLPLATLDQLEREATAEDYRNDLAAAVLLLPAPEAGIPLLKQLLAVENPYVAFDAAVILALWRDPAGLGLLGTPEHYPMSNSNHAYAYGKAGLLQLSEAIPIALRDKHSVFHDLEELIDRCTEPPP